MKTIFVAAAFIALIFCTAWLSCPVFAASPWDDNFNDNVTNTNLWQHIFIQADPATFIESNQRLEWYVNGGNITPGQYVTDKYVSKWQFDLDTDMTFKVDFLHQTSAGDGTGLNFGLYYGDMNATPEFKAVMGVKNTVNASINDGNKVLTYNWAVAGNSINGSSGWFARTDTNGTGVLSAEYFQSDRRLQLYGSNGNRINMTLPANVSSLGVYLEGWASGGTTVLHDNPSYFDNFTAVPEPISCVLFLLGGGALLGVRRMGKK